MQLQEDDTAVVGLHRLLPQSPPSLLWKPQVKSTAIPLQAHKQCFTTLRRYQRRSRYRVSGGFGRQGLARCEAQGTEQPNAVKPRLLALDEPYDTQGS